MKWERFIREGIKKNRDKLTLYPDGYRGELSLSEREFPPLLRGGVNSKSGLTEG
ncbi:MAG: hypothetical protein JXR31_10145 [Prolixibacteraceae bacterium]|nr:hypothetical protein [Prolixibacteraceae bacterium]MBN2774598.1 hypothetical protein [Prolixibacteraceae bacterium]